MREGRRSVGRRITSLLVSLVLIAAAGWVFFNRQMLQDEITLASYQPPSEIAVLAENADLSERGKDLFYVNHPELHGKNSFSNVCKGLGDEHSNVLGCFTGSRIYIFNVTSEDLQGVREVTAAHEMLHAAYMRLGEGERKRVDGLIQQQLNAGVEPHVSELIKIYNKLEPGQLLNEMHSILATEQKKLIPELESYLAQYFDDRQTVVGLAAEYRAVFESLKTQQETLAAELDQLALQINYDTDALNKRINDYNNDVKSFNAAAAGGDMTETEFNTEKTALEQERSAINLAIGKNNNLRATYEQKRKKFESLAVEFKDLQNTIDSRPPQPQGVQ